MIPTNSPISVFFHNSRHVLAKDELGLEIAHIAIPAALALLADPIASLVDTAFVGHIGPVELAAVGVAIAIFNQASKIAIFPLVSVTTSFVAQEDTLSSFNSNARADDAELEAFLPSGTDSQSSDSIPKNVSHFKPDRRNIPSAGSAMIIAAVLGLTQALFLIFSAKLLLTYMGVDSESPMFKPARQYLTLRAVGAPAVLLSLAMHGVFRGFKDTTTPLRATVAGDVVNIILDPIFIFVFRMGVSGAAIAHVISQYIISMVLLWKLMQKVDILHTSFQDLQLARFLKTGLLLLLRVIAVTSCVTLAASLATRLGSVAMAAFQICLQFWMATSLLADGLAIAGQAILASAFARRDFEKATTTASRVLQLGLVLGVFLSISLSVVLQFASRLFSKDVNVLQLVNLGIPFIAVTQPINALAFVFDGINYGASDFQYAALSMVGVSIVSIVCLLLLSSSNGFVGIWVALSMYMSLRALAGFWRIGTGTGPWRFLRG